MLSLVTVDRPDSNPSVVIKYSQPQTVAYYRDNNLGDGTLYIAEDQLTWRHDVTGQGFQLLYPQISLHAISKDLRNFHSECLYLIFESEETEDDIRQHSISQDNPNHQEEEDGTAADDQLNELRLVPRDLNSLDLIYRAVSDCQLLHPDPEDDVLYGDDEEDSLIPHWNIVAGSNGNAGDNGFQHLGEDENEAEQMDTQFEDA